MASALAHSLFRTSSIDQGMHTSAGGISQHEMAHYRGRTPDARIPSPLPPGPMFLKDLSRSSSSASTQSSANLMFQQANFHTRTASLSAGKAEEYHRQQQHNRTALPGLTTLASIASTQEPQIRQVHPYPFMPPRHPTWVYHQMAPVPTPGISGNNNMPPVCQNCETSTTPLWRRDESGSVLCNACGLFLKLHGRPRPISLKTDVIKARNRVKSSTQGPRKQHHQSLPASQSIDLLQNGAHRRVSQIGGNLYSERSQSPISRTGTPSMHHDPNIAPQHMFDGVSLQDHVFQTPALPSLGNHHSPGSLGQLDGPMSYEQLVAQNAVLKTRVSELEVINMVFTDNENNIRRERDDAMRGQEDLKRRIEELERRVQGQDSDLTHSNKRLRMDEPTVEDQQQLPALNDAPPPTDVVPALKQDNSGSEHLSTNGQS